MPNSCYWKTGEVRHSQSSSSFWGGVQREWTEPFLPAGKPRQQEGEGRKKCEHVDSSV